MVDRAVLEFEAVWKSYPQPGGQSLHALRDVSISASPAESVAIVGRSGSGKSTFLHLAAGIDQPTRGSIRFGDRDLARMGERERTLYRRDRVGLVFQFFHLLPHLSVRDNVALPAIIAGDSWSGHRTRVDQLLERVELGSRASENVQRLSGGEMQRVAICRSLLRRPRLLLADEPTGNLDDRTAKQVMDLLLELAREEGSTLIYVTHSREMASRADTIWQMHSGILEVC